MHGRDGQFAIAVFDACFLKGSFGHALRELTVVHEEGREAKAMLAKDRKFLRVRAAKCARLRRVSGR